MAEWIVLETIRRIHPLHCLEYLRLHGHDFGIDSALSYIDRSVNIMYRKDQFDQKAEWAFEKILKNPTWYDKSHEEVIRVTKAYKKIADKIEETDLARLSDRQLANLYLEYYNAYRGSHRSGQIDNLIEFEHEYLTNYVKGILEKQIKKRNLKISVADAFNIVSMPEEQTKMQQQEKDFLALAKKLFKKPKTMKVFRKENPNLIEVELKKEDEEFYHALDDHFKRYNWLPFMYEGPAWEKSYFINLFSSLVKQKGGLKSLEKNLKEEELMLKKRRKLLKQLALKGRDKKFVAFVPESIYLKGIRKEQMYHACYVSENLFREIGKRLHLSLDQVRYFIPEEVAGAILKKKYDVNVLNQRLKFGVFRIIDGQEEFLIGDHARRFYYQIYKEKKYTDIKELNGSCGFPGKVKGRVRVINHPNEMFAMEEGDIMVSHSTNPNLVPAMKKSAAIVTDVGGITCHAAVVSRELKKPCVIGTKIATRVLKDKDLVKVDAKEGTVKKVKR